MTAARSHICGGSSTAVTADLINTKVAAKFTATVITQRPHLVDASRTLHLESFHTIVADFEVQQLMFQQLLHWDVSFFYVRSQSDETGDLVCELN